MALAAACLVFFACLGAGAALLRLLRVAADHQGWEGVIWSFAAGFGTVGWLGFFLAATGWLSTSQLIIFCAVCSLGVVYFRPGSLSIEIAGPWTPRTCLLLLAAAIVAVISVMQGISPPTDADSLAYHFALPKQFIQYGELEFVPRAVTTDDWGQAELVIPTFTMRGGISASFLKLEDEVTDREFFFGIGEEPMDVFRVTMRPGAVGHGERFLVVVEDIGPPQPIESPKP